ncbi:MAG: hypothetical protein ACOVJ6_09690, partial [Pirellulales bacterium]
MTTKRDGSTTSAKPARRRPSASAVTAPDVDRDALLGLYRAMLTIRLTEEELARCHQRGLLHGACHTYVGQEAIATGV